MCTVKRIAVVGQGYVGLPLALSFARHYPVIGYDTHIERIDQLLQGIDHTKQARSAELQEGLQHYDSSSGTVGYYPSADPSDLLEANIYIITVPTPIDAFNAPDLRPLREASAVVGAALKQGDIVIYESTVYPGCTEEECVPVLAAHSGLVYNEDFFVGYSPERINPGDNVHTLETIVKVTSGSTPETARIVDELYQTIIKAGTHLVRSIRIAEAAKVIENAQRDVNISFVNELALIFDRLGIDTHEVLAAARTKFNFLPFQPGLVGGHCISVDPYYLAHKAIQVGYYPDVILSGRRVNDQIPLFIASKVVKMMVQKKINVSQSRVLLLGFAFKENCPDTRNTKVAQIYYELSSYGVEVVVYDPLVDAVAVQHEHGIAVCTTIPRVWGEHLFDAVILTTAHDVYRELVLSELLKPINVVFDSKAFWDKAQVDGRL